MKALVAVLFIAAAGASGYALYLSRQAEADRQQIADLQTQLREAIPEPVVPDEASAFLEAMRRQQNDPKNADILRAQRRKSLPSSYPNLGRWLELTDEQESSLFDLLARQEEVQRTKGTKGFDPDVLRTHEAELAAMLGNKYPLLQQYQLTMPLHRQISQLQSRLASSADRLGDAQAMALTTALVTEQLRLNREREPFKPSMNPQEYMQVQRERAREHKRLLEIAASELNPRQLESYRALIHDEEERATALYRNFNFAEAAGPASGP